MKLIDKILGIFGLVRKKNTIDALVLDYHKWAAKQFPNSTCESSIVGLKREVDELHAEVNLALFGRHVTNGGVYQVNTKQDVAFEYVDVLMYTLDSSRRFGIAPMQLFDYFRAKLEVNKARQWAKNPDDSYSHVK